MTLGEAAVAQALSEAGKASITRKEFRRLVKQAEYLAREPEPGPSREQRRRLTQIAEGRLKP